MENAVAMLREQGATPDKVGTLLASTKFRADLLLRVSKNPDLNIEQQEIVDSLAELQDAIKETLAHKSIFRRLWEGAKNVTIGAAKILGKVLTNPLVLTALLAILGFYLWTGLNDRASKLEESAMHYARETQERARAALPVLSPPATDNLTQSGDAGSSVAPGAGAEAATKSAPPVVIRRPAQP